MEKFATRSAQEREPFFTESAARKGVLPLIIEKDFWVSWCLRRVFQMSDIPGHIFKGGTSLSKVYGLINRFSEDIDISLDRSGLGFGGDKDPAKAPSRKKREELTGNLKQTCGAFIANELLPRFAKACEEKLGRSGWRASLDERDPDQQSIVFEYPRSLADYGTGAYLAPSVLLEFGCRGDQWPAEDRGIKPFVAEGFPDQFENAEVRVKVLAAERTFWEKVTLLHSENHRPKEKAIPERLSRHYSDVAIMYRSEIGKKAINTPALLDEVVKHKRVFFPSGWANYDAAKLGSLALAPNPDLEKALRRDYEQMKDMFFGTPESFDSILSAIHEMEGALNKTDAVAKPTRLTPSPAGQETSRS